MGKDAYVPKHLTPLIFACQKGNAKAVTALLELPVDPNESVKSGISPYGKDPQLRYQALLTPLNEAAKMGHSGIVETLLANEATPDEGTLICAVQGKSIKALQSILAKGVTSGINIALAVAIENQDYEATKFLLICGANANGHADEAQNTMLMSAIANNNMRIAELLVSCGANVNARNLTGVTALMKAAKKNNTTAITFLLHNGADSTLKSSKQPLKKNVQRLKRHGIDESYFKDESRKQIDPQSFSITEHIENMEDDDILDLTAEGIATKFKHQQAAQLLQASPKTLHPTKIIVHPNIFAKQAKVLAESGLGEFALIDAIFQNTHGLAVALINQNINLDHIWQMSTEISNDGWTKRITALTAACARGNHEIVCLLLEKNADPNLTYRPDCYDHVSPLNEAAKRGHVAIVQTLLKYKAKPDRNTPPMVQEQQAVLNMILNKHGYGQPTVVSNTNVLEAQKHKI